LHFSGRSYAANGFLWKPLQLRLLYHKFFDLYRWISNFFNFFQMDSI